MNQTIRNYSDCVIINGKMYPKPEGKGCAILIINCNVFINRREYKNGKWRYTLRSLWYSLIN